MAALNNFQGIGNLTNDVDIRYSQDGKCVANFTIAMNEKWKDKQGQPQEKTEFLRCVAWGKLGEICGEYLKKGSLIYVSGKVRTKKYTKDDIVRYTTEIEAMQMQMLSPKNHGEPGQNKSSSQRESSDSAEDD